MTLTLDRVQTDPVRHRIGHAPALDGLRAGAVAAVMAFHFVPDRMPGGFLGVDTFFVVSGYLITSLLLAEWRDERGVDLRAFWARRARRLLPVLFLVLAAVAVAGAVWIPAIELGRLRGDGLASLFYVNNWRQIATGQSYFDASTSPSPLRHLWSLAIEEQYYLIWPLVVLGCLRLGRGRRFPLGLVCAVGTGASAAAMAFLYRSDDPSRAYYGTDTRAHVILVGAALALVLEGRRIRSPRVTGAVQVAAVAAAAWCAWLWLAVGERDSWLYQGGFLAYAVATAVIITAVVATGGGPLGRGLSLRPVQAIGRISYGLYLWHWPVQLFATPGRTGLDGAPLLLAKVAVTGALSVASYLLVEQPVRRRRWADATVRRLAPASVVAVVGALIVATLGAAPVPAHLRGLDDQTAVSSPGDVVRPTGAVGAAPVGVALPRSAALFGDSVSVSLQDDLASVLAGRGVLTVKSSVGGCGVIEGEPLDLEGRPEPFGAACADEIVRRQTRFVARYRPDLVVWLSYWEWRDRLVNGTKAYLGTSAGDAAILGLMARAVDRMTAAGGRVVILLLPTPQDTDSYTHQPGFADAVPHLNELFGRLAAGDPDRVSLVDLGEIVCGDATPCPERRDGVRVREDGLHFTPEGSAWVARRLTDELLDPALWPAPSR